jgi:hypothetical protein
MGANFFPVCKELIRYFSLSLLKANPLIFQIDLYDNQQKYRKFIIPPKNSDFSKCYKIKEYAHGCVWITGARTYHGHVYTTWSSAAPGHFSNTCWLAAPVQYTCLDHRSLCCSWTCPHHTQGPEWAIPGRVWTTGAFDAPGLSYTLQEGRYVGIVRVSTVEAGGCVYLMRLRSMCRVR